MSYFEIFVRSSDDIKKTILQRAEREGRVEQATLNINRALCRAAARDFIAAEDIARPHETAIIQAYSTLKIT